MADGFLYKSVNVEGTANEETVEDIITSTVEEPVSLVAVSVIEYTAAENSDAVLAMYIGREKIVDLPIIHGLTAFDSDVRLAGSGFYPLGHDLDAGESFKVGHVSGAVASDISYVLQYKIAE